MATKSKTPGARGRAARSQRRRAVQQHVRASATPCGDGVTLADDERQPCEVWTRVMGYHRPLDSFNAGKRAEYDERRYFREPESEQ